jgi:hypothetical protein
MRQQDVATPVNPGQVAVHHGAKAGALKLA